MDHFWSNYVQTSEELYSNRALRFREDNGSLWISAMKIADGMSVLEVGCGGGIFCHRIKTILPRCTVTGLDRDGGHIAFARRKTEELGLDCSFVQGDALALPFADNSFDATTSHTVIEHVETGGFLREQLRVLKPGGVISVLSVRTSLNVNPENWLPEDPEEAALLEKAWKPSCDLDKQHGVAQYEKKAESEFPLALEQAGFAAVNVDFFSVTTYAPDNASCPRELALRQINDNRLGALASVEKALRRSPGALTDAERERLLSLINKRYDRRVVLYERGEKLWDISTSTVMAVTGVKPGC